MLGASSKGSSGGSENNTYIRKSRSAQMKLDLEELSGGQALSRASSATEDLEAGTSKMKFQTEPTLPIYLKFTDVSYKVIIKGITSSEKRDILNGISGSANPGEVLALMGPSGFVTQDDVLFQHLTVKETLTYAARLRLPKVLTKQQKEKRAVDVIHELGLERCQDTMIGGSFVRGVSGGERKRVCIGNEIIINPSLLFLDEPTSGLDSTTALRTIQTLQDIAEVGKTVITTIHQPSSRLFHKFDKLILLGKGSLLYFGKASEAMLEDKVQMGNSEAEFRNGKPPLAAVHEYKWSSMTINLREAKYLVEAYESRVADGEKRKLMAPLPLDEELKSKVSSSKRQWGARAGGSTIILGLLWWQSDSKTTRGRQDQAGLLFFISVFWGFFPVFTAIFTFPQERAMLGKERAADMYRLSALETECYSFFLTMLTVFLCIVAAQGLGLAIGATNGLKESYHFGFKLHGNSHTVVILGCCRKYQCSYPGSDTCHSTITYKLLLKNEASLLKAWDCHYFKDDLESLDFSVAELKLPRIRSPQNGMHLELFSGEEKQMRSKIQHPKMGLRIVYGVVFRLLQASSPIFSSLLDKNYSLFTSFILLVCGFQNDKLHRCKTENRTETGDSTYKPKTIPPFFLSIKQSPVIESSWTKLQFDDGDHGCQPVSSLLSSVGGRSPRRSTSMERATFGEIPAGLFRRALHRIRQRKLPEKGLNQRSHDGFHNEGFEIPAVDGVEEIFGCVETEKAANELEKEMWQKFWDWILEKSFSSPRIE
ncbi:ABC transporter G family member 22 [Hibiscus syriacus]|uniref:ABC transporter G family member 22 n=1 Tax=Hibiscus syriacus TaxID=106335 RepID=A0A6A3CHN8_HIBSY|nr:ABC transporter G family member 22 [Hibiscus syriacus]